jgi:hypothetical protein
MLVDYDWVKAILEGTIEYTQYDVNNQVTDTSGRGRISYIDIKFKSSRDLIWPWFFLSNIDVAGSTSPFTYSLSAGGPWVKTLEVEKNVIPRNGSIRVFVRTANNYDRTEHAAARLRLTPGGDWQPPTWLTPVFGYDLVAVRSDAISFRYFDNAGNERSAGDINNATIGSVVVTLNLDDTFPNTSFTINGEGGTSNLFLYSLYPNGPWNSSLNWNVGNASNGTAVRVYVQFQDPRDGNNRYYTQLRVNGSIAGQARSALSASYSGLSSAAYWIQPAMTVGQISFVIDDSGIIEYNMRLGTLTMRLNNDRRSYSRDSTVGGQAWNPGLRGTGFEDYGNYVAAAINVPALARPGIGRSSSFGANVTKNDGRGRYAVQQNPSAGNDYTLIFKVNDPDDGPGGYVFTIDTWINQ